MADVPQGRPRVQKETQRVNNRQRGSQRPHLARRSQSVEGGSGWIVICEDGTMITTAEKVQVAVEAPVNASTEESELSALPSEQENVDPDTGTGTGTLAD
ncbi:hypothetical protein NDU88_002750 [Pleurodeles waltl]|uniref:Uncharacterized protein n=1 Tax=Pleurodeles waltl TaxID=8319 RepID=A0AAV7RB89_PLEWA|nr:hypothetical protein NDU88_002750 [Pleurodeles waltl]